MVLQYVEVTDRKHLNQRTLGYVFVGCIKNNEMYKDLTQTKDHHKSGFLTEGRGLLWGVCKTLKSVLMSLENMMQVCYVQK